MAVPLTDQLIAGFKKQFPKIYKKVLLDQEFVFRPLTRAEYKDILIFLEDNRETLRYNDLDEKCFERCCIFPAFTPAEKATLPAGVIPTISKAIQEKSGFEISEVFGQVVPSPAEVVAISSSVDPVQPTAEEIEAAKAKTQYKILKVTAGDIVVLVRGMGRLEWNAIMSKPEEDGDTAMCKRTVIWPKEMNWDEIDAGVAPAIARTVMRASGFELTANVEEL